MDENNEHYAAYTDGYFHINVPTLSKSIADDNFYSTLYVREIDSAVVSAIKQHVRPNGVNSVAEYQAQLIYSTGYHALCAAQSNADKNNGAKNPEVNLALAFLERMSTQPLETIVTHNSKALGVITCPKIV